MIKVEEIVLKLIDERVKILEDLTTKEITRCINENNSSTVRLRIPETNIGIIAYNKFKQQFKNNSDYNLIELDKFEREINDSFYNHVINREEIKPCFFRIHIKSDLYKFIRKGVITDIKDFINYNL